MATIEQNMRKTKAELCDMISDLEHQIDLQTEDAQLNEEDFKHNLKKERDLNDVLRSEMRELAKEIYDRYPEVADSIESVADNESYSFCAAEDSVIMAVVPRGTSRVRFDFLAKRLEFEHNELGVRYWASPLTGDIVESDVA